MNHFHWADMADMMELEGETHSGYVRQALDDLADEKPGRVLDIGSGPGVTACLMAERFPDAEVTAVDGTPELLQRAKARAERHGLTLNTVNAEFPAGLEGLPTADLIWSGQVVHHVGDQQGVLSRLTGLLEPGGVLGIVEGGLPTRWLPRDLGFGKPGLQERLDLASAVRFAEMRAELPGTVSVVEDWQGMLAAAGLTEVRSKTFLVDLPPPLADGPRTSIRRTLERYRGMLEDRVDAEDLAAIDRLLDPADPAGIANRSDVFVLSARTVHFGRKKS